MPRTTAKNPHARSNTDALVAIGQRKPPAEWTPAVQEEFLTKLAQCGLKMVSAAYAGISSETVRKYRRIDKAFRAQCEAAEAVFGERLSAEATRRGLEGHLMPVVQKGQQVYEDCEMCKGWGRRLPPKAFEQGVDSLVPRNEWPWCKDCHGTGKGDPLMERRFDSQLLQLQLRAYDKTHRGAAEADAAAAAGGVLAVPQRMTADEWTKRHRGDQDAAVIPCGICGSPECDIDHTQDTQ